MPEISRFFGVVVLMFWFDNKKHNLPHIHVRHGSEKAVFNIETGEIIEGNIAKNKLKLVQAWIEIHKEELNLNWELAIKGESLRKISSLQ